MEDIAATVAGLRDRVAAAERELARTEAIRQQAEQAVQSAMSALKSEFDADDVEQARKLLDYIDKQIENEADLVNAALGKAG